MSENSRKPFLLVDEDYDPRTLCVKVETPEPVQEVFCVLREHIPNSPLVESFYRKVFKIFDKCMSMEEYCRMFDPQIRPRVAAVGDLRPLDLYIDNENKFLDALSRLHENNNENAEAMEPDDLYN